MFELEVYHPHVTEVTVINRQSYMAEISSLLGLITDEHTRVALIEQMDRMFDAAPDEEKLIQEIGNPTKVAVALIRYADSGKITPAAAPVIAPEQVQPPKPVQHIDETQYRPVEDVVLDTAGEPDDGDYSEDEPYEDDGYYSEEEGSYEDDGDYAEEEGSYEDDGYYSEEEGLYEDDGYDSEEEGLYEDDGYDSEEEGSYEDDGYYSEEEEPYEDDGYYAEEEQYEDDSAYVEDGAYYGDEENPFTEMFDELEVETVTKTNPFLVVLYTIAAIIVGVPVFAVLLVLNVCFLAIGAAVLAGGVGLIATAFIGLSVVADMLILLGGGATVFAIALVVLWFAIWFFIQVTLGWIRVLVRLGKSGCCKEVEVA